MCGIAGFLTPGGAPPDRSLLRRMCDRLEHRGPDAAGYYCGSGVALGHRRLSIIDLSGGAQPLGNEDGTVQIVFNGEIYNYAELRSDLLRRGHCFSTASDTEVIVHLYEEVGDRVPEYLNGMFAFAIWDAPRRELFLARDRFGKKPLYYSEWQPGAAFAFASELKALTAMPGFRATVRPDNIANFLSLSYVPEPGTIYNEVHKLPPAHSLRVGESGLRLRRYWRAPFGQTDTRSEEDLTSQVQELAADAVKCRLMSDVPLGGFLSGGVDSSAVVAFMAKHAPDRVKTFSIGFTNKVFDELEFARLVVERYKTDHHEEVVSLSIGEMLDKLADTFDEPFGDSSAIPMLYLSRMTRKHVTVALSGDGADELFGGYRRYRFGVLEERVRNVFPQWFRKPVFSFAGRHYPKFDYLPQVFRGKTLLGNIARSLGDSYFTSMSTFRDEALDRILSPELKARMGDYSPREAFRDRFDAVRELKPLEQMQSVDFDTYLPGDILVKADRTTMAYSLESRSPLLDYRLGELACRLPSGVKLRNGIGKSIFKRAVSPYVPVEAIERRKMGFSVPLAEWFRTSLKPVYREQVLRPGMEQYICPTESRRLYEQHQTGRHDHSRKLWNLLMLGVWASRHREMPTSEALPESSGVLSR